MNRQPKSDEYGSYYQGYVSAVQTDAILSYLEQQKTAVLDFLRSVNWEQW